MVRRHQPFRRRLRQCVLLLLCIVVPFSAISQEWQITQTAIIAAEGVSLRGTVQWPDRERTQTPVVVKINNAPVNDWHRLCVKWARLEQDNQYVVTIDLFYDPMSKGLFFAKPGRYNVIVLNASGESALFSQTVEVAAPKAKDQEAFRLFADTNSIEVLLAHTSNTNGLSNLEQITKKYPDSPWATFAKLGLGISRFEQIKRRPIESKADVNKRQKDLVALAPYFEEAARGHHGFFALDAKLHLAHCLALKGEYDRSQDLLSEVVDAHAPDASEQASQLLKEIRRRSETKAQGDTN